MEKPAIQWNQRLSRLLFTSAGAAAAAVAAAVALSSLFVTCVVEIDWVEVNNERVHLLLDNPLVSLAVLALALGLMKLSLRALPSRGVLNALTAGMLLTVTVLGCVWVYSASAKPYADSEELTRLAAAAASGSMEELAGSEYIRRYPFQLGYLLYLEGCARLLGTEKLLSAQYFNVLWLALADYGIVRLTRTMTEDPRAEVAVIALTWIFLPPVFLTTFLYGTIPGLCCAVWAVECVCRFLKNGRAVLLLPAAALSALAVTLKMNYAIVLAACAIVLLLRALNSKRLLPLVFAAGMCLLSILLPKGVKAGYEARSGVSFGPGTPQTAWLVTGASESSLFSGWYCGYTNQLMPSCGYDAQAASQKARGDLQAELNKFSGRPRYLISFFARKFLSQWEEPEFQSIWSSQADFNRASAPNALAQNVYTGPLREGLHAVMSHARRLIYCALALGAVFLTADREKREGLLIPGLIFLGAALYHLLFEAKSQYALPYVCLALPLAGFGLSRLHTLARFPRRRGGRDRPRQPGRELE